MKNKAHFNYFETSDQALLARYVELRRTAYLREYPWLSADFGVADATDRVSHIVIATSGSNVIGGARLTVSTPESPRPMPLEEAGFSLGSCPFLQHLSLDRKPYGEISRMAISPEVSHGFEISGSLSFALAQAAARAGVDTLFSICPDKPARLNQINAHRLGVRFQKFDRLSTVFGVDMWLCVFTGVLRLGAHSARRAA